MNTLYEEWLDSKSALSEAKKKELELRNQIIDDIDSNQVSGTLKHEDDSYKIAIGFTIRNTLDEPALNTIMSSLKDEEKNCIVFKPGLVAKELKELSPESKLWEAIITKPGQNTLKIERKESME